MNAEDILANMAWALPFLAIAGIFYCIAALKKGKGQGLHTEGQRLLASGHYSEARHVLLQALWKANETPQLEREILADLTRVYERIGVAFNSSDYEVLVRQFEQLSVKHSHKAISEMKKVQALKKELIGGMPDVAKLADAADEFRPR